MIDWLMIYDDDTPWNCFLCIDSRMTTSNTASTGQNCRQESLTRYKLRVLNVLWRYLTFKPLSNIHLHSPKSPQWTYPSDLVGVSYRDRLIFPWKSISNILRNIYWIRSPRWSWTVEEPACLTTSSTFWLSGWWVLWGGISVGAWFRILLLWFIHRRSRRESSESYQWLVFFWAI